MGSGINERGMVPGGDRAREGWFRVPATGARFGTRGLQILIRGLCDWRGVLRALQHSTVGARRWTAQLSQQENGIAPVSSPRADAPFGPQRQSQPNSVR